jgi:hypothetical protein
MEETYNEISKKKSTLENIIDWIPDWVPAAPDLKNAKNKLKDMRERSERGEHKGKEMGSGAIYK